MLADYRGNGRRGSISMVIREVIIMHVCRIHRRSTAHDVPKQKISYIDNLTKFSVGFKKFPAMWPS